MKKRTLFNFWQVLPYLCLFMFSLQGYGQTLPANFSRQQVVSGLNSPTAMAFVPDGRALICQQGGQLRVVKNGSLLSAPAISLSVSTDGERGLIGVAVDPDFNSNQRVYLFYVTSGGSPQTRISRFTMNGDVLQASSETILVTFANSHRFHNGGGLAFGQDGNLYVSIGEDTNTSNSQNLDSYKGKVLRITTSGGVPAGNPFSGGAARSRVWSYGLRNPYTMGVDPVSGKLFVNDVGNATWEEINNATSGGINFGWPNSEGACSGACDPVYFYRTNRAGSPPDGEGCSIVGGTFFNGAISNYPGTYNGKYFFLDYCGGWINYIDPDSPSRQSFGTGLGDGMVYIRQGTDGNLYYLRRTGGTLNRIVYTGSSCPTITAQPQGVTVDQGQSATFSVAATGTGLSYQWRKNSVNIAGATASSYTINNVQLADAGNYSVVVSASGCTNVISNEATLTVTDDNQAPVPQITSPAHNSFFGLGSTVSFSGTATDPEDGVLPASAFDWTVTFHHANHTHPGPFVQDGQTSGSFVADSEGHTDPDIWYRIYLTVTDSDGKEGTTYVDVYPALPAPWVNGDIGSVAVAGSAGHVGGDFALLGNGADIWSTADAFHYVYRQVSGDVEIIGQVERLENTHGFAKAGFMIRESLAANAVNALVAITPENGVTFQRRTTTGGSSVSTKTPATAPVWLRLTRTGNTITGYMSSDGSTWTAVASESIAMGSTAFIGMAITSHTVDTITSAVVRDVNLNVGDPNELPQVNITSPANGAAFTEGSDITITADASDSDGTIASVEFFQGATSLGVDTSAPYSAVWTNAPAGAHALTARATDNEGGFTTSSAVNITVSPVSSCDPVTASGDDGNVAANVLDGDLNTRWSADGDGQWIQFCLDTEQTVTGVEIAFYKGDERTATFDIQTSADGSAWTTAAAGLVSSGTTLNHEPFSITPQPARYVRIVGHGNSVNAWNSYAEVEVTTQSSTTCTEPVTASGDDGNVAGNVLDNDLATRWSASGDGEWIRFCLDNVASVSGVQIAFYKGDERQAIFDIQLSMDGTSWTTVSSNVSSSGTSLALETFTFAAQNAQYVRILGHGNSVNAWNSYTEVEINSTPASASARTGGPGTAFLAAGEETLAGELDLAVYPNPSDSKMTVRYRLKETSEVKMSLYNTAGRELAILVNERQRAGVHTATIDVSTLPAGVHILKLTNNGKLSTCKLLRN